jgi:sigma-54 interacting transcriptional regulator
MILRALRLRLPESGKAALEIASWSGAPHDLADGQFAGVYIVANDAVPLVRRLTPRVNYRGKKHPARALSAMLLGQPGIPLVEAFYKSGRSLSGSVRTALAKALRSKERKPYIIGVPSKAFEEAAARVGVVLDGPAESSAPADQELLLSEPVEVPPALEKKVIGESPEMHIVRRWIVRAADHEHPVVILGESGTGKELVARAIHDLQRGSGPFQPVNCGAIAAELFESQLFGYVPGAFTGGLKGGDIGMWRKAKGGTVFLDEIGELAPRHQASLLRVLQERKVLPVGGKSEEPVDARVIAATNRDLRSMMESGEFRDDLYYRLGSMFITLPPLRDRPEDVELLAAHFWKHVAPLREPLSEEVLKELRQYRWRGNARELRYVLVNLHTTFQKTIPTVAHVRAVVRMAAPREIAGGAAGAEGTIQLVEYLRHLRRAQSAIEACQRMITSLGRQSFDPDHRSHLAAEVGGCLTELQLLGVRPERFQNVAMFELTHRLAGGLAAFQTLFDRNDDEALRYGKKELKAEAALAATAVRREEERILQLL